MQLCLRVRTFIGSFPMRHSSDIEHSADMFNNRAVIISQSDSETGLVVNLAVLFLRDNTERPFTINQSRQPISKAFRDDSHGARLRNRLRDFMYIALLSCWRRMVSDTPVNCAGKPAKSLRVIWFDLEYLLALWAGAFLYAYPRAVVKYG